MLSAIMGGVNAATSLMGAFGGSKRERIVDPFTQQAVDQLNAAQQSNQNAYESNLAAGSRNMNAMANDAYKQVAGSMASNGYDSSDASMKAVAATKSGSMLGSYMDARNNATNQYTQNAANIASKIGEQAAQVHYQETPDFATKLGQGLSTATSGAMSGIKDGMKLDALAKQAKFDEENQNNATTDAAKAAAAAQQQKNAQGATTAAMALAAGPAGLLASNAMFNPQQSQQKTAPVQPPSNTKTLPAAAVPSATAAQIPATIAAQQGNNQSSGNSAGGMGPVDWWSQKIKPFTVFRNY